MTTMTAVAPATEKQLAFIQSLLDQRDVDPEYVAVIKDVMYTLNKGQASGVIDKLVAAPRKTKSKAATAPAPELLAIPKSKYAIPAEHAHALSLDADTSIHGDLLFLEVREYMKHVYMRRLTGAPGGFTRHKLSRDDTIALAKYIARDPYEFARLFGEHYSCCGKCGAELTDPTSRELQLGPECRKAFGF